MTDSILVVGAGKVGTATALSLNCQVNLHDPPRGIINSNINDHRYIIVCVDTVQKGPDDYVDIESALDEVWKSGYSGIVLIRSTVSPYKITEWEKRYGFEIVLFPEFLSQRDGEIDTSEPWIVLLGGSSDNVSDVKDFLIKYGYSNNANAYTMVSAQEAAIIKLSDNAALATRVVMFNAIKIMCDEIGADYEKVRHALGSDKRIGISHSIVPSPDDALMGFGGHCLPKDTKAMATLDKTGFFNSVMRTNKFLGRK